VFVTDNGIHQEQVGKHQMVLIRWKAISEIVLKFASSKNFFSSPVSQSNDEMKYKYIFNIFLCSYVCTSFTKMMTVLGLSKE
jgi:hypothetical protein